MKNVIKPPTWFMVVSVLALIWNILGVMAYLGQAFITPEMLEAMPEAEAEMIQNRPAWATAAFAVAVWCGALASLFLLLKKTFAYQLFWLSFIGILVQMAYNFLITSNYDAYGPGGIAMALLVPTFGILLILLSKKAKKETWIS